MIGSLRRAGRSPEGCAPRYSRPTVDAIDAQRGDDPCAEFVRRAQRGDRLAFGELVRSTQQQVYNLAYHFFPQPQEAEDLTQEIYLRAWRALPDFRGEAHFSTWLYRIAANVCLNRRRQIRARPTTVEDEALLERVPSGQGDPETLVAAQDRKARLWQAVNLLPDRYRLVLALFYQQQLSYDEVAKALALPLGTVKAQLNRARQALAGILRKEASDDL